MVYLALIRYLIKSLSARRAWIEITGTMGKSNRAIVALRKESVDRNTPAENPMISVDVALRKESVDRNYQQQLSRFDPALSLSARRAWIEIFSVREVFANFESLSARRAWIEIPRP